MSTLQENLTPILKTSGSITNSSVKSEEAIFISAEPQTFQYGYCEKISDKEENFKKVLKNISNKVDSPKPQPKFETFDDLLNAAKYLSGSREELDHKINGNEDTFDNCDEKLIIDIKPTVLQQEQFLNKNDFGVACRNFEASTKTYLNIKKNHISKKRLNDVLKSLCALCDICDDKNTERVIKLNRHERIVAAVVLMKSSGTGIETKKIFPIKIPKQSCGRCFTKIILFYNRHKNRRTQRKIKEETGQIMDPISHGYHCQCLMCQNQYGALPVLLKGIEEQNKMQSSQLQVNFPPEHNLDISQRQNVVNFQPQPVDVVTSGNQEPVNFQQFSIKYEEDSRKSFQPQLQEHFYTSQSTSQSYSHFQIPESSQTSSKTDICSGQTGGHFSEQRLSVEGQTQFDLNFQSHSQYYSSETNVSNIQTFAESSSCAREEHLPTLLKELEDKCQTELASQPSTSSGIQGQSHVSDEKQSKKILTCVHCNKNFTHKGDFNKHLRKHTKERPYKCSFCDKMFSHTSNLHRHQRIHSGDRPFRCQHCDKCFNRKDKLESHKNSKFCKNRRNWK